MNLRRRRTALITATVAMATAAAAGGLVTAFSAQAATGCQVSYSIASQWPGGFGANISITNFGDPINGWTLAWNFTAGQAITQSWGFTASPASGAVIARNADYTASIPTNGSVGGGFNGTWNSSSNPVPTSFTLNGTVCTGAVTTTGTSPTTPPTTRATTSPTTRATTPPTTGPTSQPPAGTLYVSPNGSASAPGTESAPTTLVSAITRVTAGGTIYLRAGTYNFAQTVTIEAGNNGTANARKRLSAYPGERPVLNFSAQAEDPANRGLAVNGNYWHVYNIIVERAGDNGIFVGGSNNIFERTITRFNRDSGLQLSRTLSSTPQSQWPANNLILSAESHDNADSDGEDADGFAPKLTVGPGNIFRYAVSHNNIDDGWDLFTKTDTGPIGIVTIEDSLSYNNGTLSNGGQAGNGDRNGFKLGGEDISVNHIVRRNIAYHNGKHGFTYNRNLGTIAMSNNISIDSGERNFQFDGGTSVFRNNTSCFSSGGTNDRTIGNVDSSNQFWAGANGSRCSTLSGALAWSFATDGRLIVTLGGRTVTP